MIFFHKSGSALKYKNTKNLAHPYNLTIPLQQIVGIKSYARHDFIRSKNIIFVLKNDLVSAVTILMILKLDIC